MSHGIYQAGNHINLNSHKTDAPDYYQLDF